ncbi:hypothetical protein, partial [Helicobacter typhlonius]|uniref:hypothetical protein n=1 Tax=Helicobacter typhlonius TaxID=76936 RepID=UPI002FE04522
NIDFLIILFLLELIEKNSQNISFQFGSNIYGKCSEIVEIENKYEIKEKNIKEIIDINRSNPTGIDMKQYAHPMAKFIFKYSKSSYN